jgi:glucose/arabinose dehydrogenase
MNRVGLRPILVWGSILAGGALRAESRTPITAERMTFALDAPVFAASPPGDARIFVAEKGGTIRILRGGVLLPTPFLDWSDEVLSDQTERGLLGLAFHPDYGELPRFYVYYAALDGDIRIVEFEVSSNPDVADPRSVRPIVTIPHGNIIHFGGWMGFGPDGYLYVSVGDGAVPANAQDITNQLLGKILRLDVNGDDFPADAIRNYGIPADNPFVGMEGDDEIWAFGLRNPWRCGFDRVTGDLYITDVGSRFWEEINVQRAGRPGGANYGWPCVEGDRCLNAAGCDCDDPSFIAPAFAYPHTRDCAIIGGYVYRGCAVPELQGAYLFADYCSAGVWSVRWIGERLDDLRAHQTELTPTHGRLRSISSFGENQDGELFICNHGGSLYRVVPRPECSDCDGNGFSDECEIELGTGEDQDGDGILDSCRTSAGLTASNPPSGSIDARQSWEGDGSISAGWTEIEWTFDEAVEPLSPGDFCIRQEGGDLPPLFVSAVEFLTASRVRLIFNRPLTPCVRTHVARNNGGGSIDLAYSPGDVNGDGWTTVQDVSTFIAMLGDTQAHPWSVDMDRSNEKTPFDGIRLIDLLHGVTPLDGVVSTCVSNP